MALEGLFTPEILLFLLLGVIFVFVGLKILKYLTRLILVAIVFALIPFGLQYMGFAIEVSVQNVMWFGLFGILVFFAYHSMKTGFKILGFVSKPLRKVEGKSKKEKDKEKRKKLVKKMEEEHESEKKGKD